MTKLINLINLTPHPISLLLGEETITVPPSGQIARLVGGETTEIQGEGGIPLFIRVQPTEVENLPPPQEGHIFVVSAMVAGVTTQRTDVFAPGTGPEDNPVRNDKGHIVAVRRLVRFK